MPARILPNVLFPAPFSPQSAWQEPSATARLTSVSACTPTNRLPTCSKRTAGTVIVGLHLEVFSMDVREAPGAKLSRPVAEVRLRDAHQFHRNDLRDVFLEADLVDDRLDADVAPLVDGLREQHRHHAAV